MRPETACVHHPLGDTFVVKMEYFFTEMEIFEQRWTPRTDLQAVLVVGDWNPLLCGEFGHVFSGRLMSLTAFASNNLLVDQLNRFLIFCHFDSLLSLRSTPDFCDDFAANSGKSALLTLFRKHRDLGITWMRAPQRIRARREPLLKGFHRSDDSIRDLAAIV